MPGGALPALVRTPGMRIVSCGVCFVWQALGCCSGAKTQHFGQKRFYFVLGEGEKVLFWRSEPKFEGSKLKVEGVNPTCGDKIPIFGDLNPNLGI